MSNEINVTVTDNVKIEVVMSAGQFQKADELFYDNSVSGLEAQNIQDAFDETLVRANEAIASITGKADRTELDTINAQLAETVQNQGLLSGLLTTAKTSLVNAINELFNNKANKAQETPIVPTLLGNWTGVAGQGPTYYKDSTGRVHLSGTVTGGAISTVIQNMPSGYRSAHSLSFAVIAGSGHGRVNITSAGQVVFAGGTPTNVYLDGISYRGV